MIVTYKKMKSGFVSIVGRPNAGKSTILNTILGEKVAIVTPKPHTTTSAIIGVFNRDNLQIVFVDTPGIHKPHKAYGELMNKASYSSFLDADVVVLVVDASLPFGTGDNLIVERLPKDKPLIIVFNKIDLARFEQVKALKEKYQTLFKDAILIETSAIRNFNLDEIISEIEKLLPEGPQYYPLDMKTISDEEFIISEIIREKIIMLTKQEIPYSVAVVVLHIENKENKKEVLVDIVTEKDSQKGIIIGKGGKLIKRIRLQSEYDLNKHFRMPVKLEILVRVEENWRDNPKLIKKLGLMK